MAWKRYARESSVQDQWLSVAIGRRYEEFSNGI